METEDIDIGEMSAASQQQQFPGQQQQQQSLDQDLLLQFSCLGTTDHEELVQQMLQILGHELSYSAAKFFLDMNNWNLQGAVGCYLDAYNNQRLPSMQIVADVTVGSGEAVTPNTNFRQAWKIQNSGEESWPEGCYLKVVAINGDNVDTLGWINHIQASNNNLSDFERVNLVESNVSVPALRPGNHTVCTVTLHSPPQCGHFQTKFRLCTQNGNFFGDTLWTIVPVTEAGTLALTQQVNDLHTSSQMVEGPPNLMDSGGMQLVEANSEFLFNRPPQNSPEAVMLEGGGGSSSTAMESGGGGSAMDADLIPTNFN